MTDSGTWQHIAPRNLSSDAHPWTRRLQGVSTLHDCVTSMSHPTDNHHGPIGRTPWPFIYTAFNSCAACQLFSNQYLCAACSRKSRWCQRPARRRPETPANASCAFLSRRVLHFETRAKYAVAFPRMSRSSRSLALSAHSLSQLHLLWAHRLVASTLELALMGQAHLIIQRLLRHA